MNFSIFFVKYNVIITCASPARHSKFMLIISLNNKLKLIYICNISNFVLIKLNKNPGIASFYYILKRITRSTGTTLRVVLSDLHIRFWSCTFLSVVIQDSDAVCSYLYLVSSVFLTYTIITTGVVQSDFNFFLQCRWLI